MDDLIENTAASKAEKDAIIMEELKDDIKYAEYKKNGVIKRTWRWTILWIFKIIELILIFWLMLLFALPMLWGGLSIFGAWAVAWTEWVDWIMAMILWFWAIIIAPFALAFVFQFFVTRWIFKWQRWSIIFIIIVSSILLILSLSKLQVEGMTFNAFVLFMAISCVKHPFYAKKG